MAVREKELAALPRASDPPRTAGRAGRSPHRPVPPWLPPPPQAGHGLLHGHDRLHRLQGLRGGVQAVEPAPRGRVQLDRQQLRQHGGAVGHVLAAREVHRAVPQGRPWRAPTASVEPRVTLPAADPAVDEPTSCARPARKPRPALADDERRLQALRHGPLPAGLPDRRHPSQRVRERLHPARHLQRLLLLRRRLPVRRHHPRHFDGHSHKCTLCYDRQKDGLVPACAKACPTASIQFGPVEELRERARKTGRGAAPPGVTGAHLYGDAPSETYSGLNSFYLLVDRPSVYGLPDKPFNPWLHMGGDYVRVPRGRADRHRRARRGVSSRDLRCQATSRSHRSRGWLRARDVTKAPPWHGLVAWDLLFNNLTTGLFLIAALGELASPALLTPVAKVAYPLALVLLLVDLVCLVLDLGDPLRFHHMLRVFKPSSPMSLGTWCLTIYSFPLTSWRAAPQPAAGWVARARVGP